MTMSSCYTLSRLKGIETLRPSCLELPFILLYTFPFEGNWNVFQFGLSGIFRDPCYTLSRLKGIETRTTTQPYPLRRSLAIHFPVWRELKQRKEKINTKLKTLAIHFPVWRELKQSPSTLVNTKATGLLYTFPFEGNWNHPHCHEVYISIERVVLLYTFPFEGNWNHLESLKDSFLGDITCYTLSRLKGIETLVR